MGTFEYIGLISAVAGIITFIWFLYEKKPIRKLSWKFAEKSANKIVNKMLADGFNPSLIFGIGRGGAIFGSMISGSMGHCPLLVIDRKYEWMNKGRLDEMIFPVTIPLCYLTNVLLVAGEAHSGSTMTLYHDYLIATGATELRRAVLFYEEGCTVNVEYFGIKSPKKKILMPWMYTKRYARADRVPNLCNEHNFKLKLYIIRHAETSAGEDIFAGTNDYDLTVKGIKQASATAQFLCGKNIKYFYSSPLNRSIKTATIICNHIPNACLNTSHDLREINFGKWEGLTRNKIKSKYSDTYNAWIDDPTTTIPEKGENPKEVLDRALIFLSDLEKTFKTSEGIEVAAISHKTVIRILLSYLGGEHLSDYRKRNVDNCEVFTLIFDNNRWTIGK